MSAQRHEILPVSSDTDIVRMRQAVRELVEELGFSLVEQTKLITAASELARNALEWGGGGTARVVNPFGTATVVAENGQEILESAEPVLTFATRSGHTYLLTKAGATPQTLGPSALPANETPKRLAPHRLPRDGSPGQQRQQGLPAD